MRTLLTITFLLLFCFVFGQQPTNISGAVIDEYGQPVSNAIIHYGKEYVSDDTAYTDKQGRFKVAYPNPQRFWYSFSIERNGFLPKTFFIDLSQNDIVLKKPLVLRSRNGSWYDSKQIDTTHIGITVREAITRYKLDIDNCMLSDEPPGVYRGFHTELADSSAVCFSIKGFFSKKRIKMIDILDLNITGFGMADTNGNERIIGKGFVFANPYYLERQVKIGK